MSVGYSTAIIRLRQPIGEITIKYGIRHNSGTYFCCIAETLTNDYYISFIRYRLAHLTHKYNCTKLLAYKQSTLTASTLSWYRNGSYEGPLRAKPLESNTFSDTTL